MTAGELVPWFSVTKLFTATAVVRLAEQGAVALDAPVQSYLPSFRLDDRSGTSVTLRHLLTHTAGLRNPIPLGWIHSLDEPAPSLDAFATQLLSRHSTLRFEPGHRFAYSNLGYLVLGRVIEAVTGEPFEEHVRKSVLAPLGMTNTGFHFAGMPATGYQKRWSLMGMASRFLIDRRFRATAHGRYVALRPFLVNGAPYGGLVGNALDMVRFATAFLDPSDLKAKGVVAESSWASMMAPGIDNSGRSMPIGLGWHLGTIDGQKCAGHLGGGGGFRSEVRLYPDLHRAAIVVANETNFDTSQVCRLVLE
jgi:CubicO group peptidase (beta-lactamase class C family)